MSIYAQLFLTFAKIGALTFGGGYAMLPLLRRELVERCNWVTDEELLDYYAIGQCTPGIIAVDTACFVGGKLAGPPGGIIATLGITFPGVVIICLLAGALQYAAHLAWVGHAFAGIRACVCAQILFSLGRLTRAAVVDVFTGILFAVTLLGAGFLGLSPVLLIIAAGLCGLCFRSVKGVRQ